MKSIIKSTSERENEQKCRREMILEEKILKHSVKHWNIHFTGISASELANKLNARHTDVLKALQKIKKDGKGTLSENVELENVLLKFNQKGLLRKPRIKKIITSIFFPGKELLNEHFKKNLVTLHNNGEFKNRLHKGYSQIKSFYFKIEVLKKYFDHPEKYSIEDSVVGGSLRINSTYSKTWTDEEIEKDFFVRLRYGKRKLKTGEYCIVEILIDLAKLPKSEQNYWESNEIINPSFSITDKDFVKFYLQTFEGEFVDYDDPIDNIKKKIREINSLFEGKLFFKITNNPYLNYPVSNTEKNYVDSCNELYKLIDESSINETLLLEVFKSLKTFKSLFLKDDNGKKLSTISIFNNFIDNLIPENKDEVKKIWKSIRNDRVSSAHKIITPSLSSNNYIDSFRDVCNNLSFSLSHLKNGLNAVLNK
jgi:hypothetical protein